MAGTRTGTVVRAMPRLGSDWAVAAGRIAAVLLDLLAADARSARGPRAADARSACDPCDAGSVRTRPGSVDGCACAPPGADDGALHPVLRPALRAWGRLHCVLRTAQQRPADGPGADLCLVVVHPDDVAAFGALARVLGRGLLPGADPRIAAVLDRVAGRTGCGAQRLVVEVARMHGVLDLELGPDGERLLAVDGLRVVGSAATAAHARVAARVSRMWQAGDADGPM